MLREALDAKSRELGGRYTLRDLARDSSVHFTQASKVMLGERRPTREVLTAWAHALHPYFPLDEALLSAGYAPSDPRKRELIRRMLAAGDDRWSDLERIIGNLLSDQQRAEQQPDDEGEDQGRHEAPSRSPHGCIC